MHQLANMPWRVIGHPNSGQCSPTVEICCMRYPRVAAVNSATACQCVPRHNVHMYTILYLIMSTVLVRIVSQWDVEGKKVFQNGMGQS